MVFSGLPVFYLLRPFLGGLAVYLTDFPSDSRAYLVFLQLAGKVIAVKVKSLNIHVKYFFVC
jgi:hypothetical protein